MSPALLKWATCVYIQKCERAYVQWGQKCCWTSPLVFADELQAGKITDICLKEKEKKKCTVTTRSITKHTHTPRLTVLSEHGISVSTHTNKSAKGAKKSSWITVKDGSEIWCLLRVALMDLWLQSLRRLPTWRRAGLCMLCIIKSAWAYSRQGCHKWMCFVLRVVRIWRWRRSLKGISVNEQTHQSAILQHDDERKQWQRNNSNRFIKQSAINISFGSSVEQCILCRLTIQARKKT